MLIPCRKCVFIRGFIIIIIFLSLWEGGADAAHRDVTRSVRRCSERECSGTLMMLERREEEEEEKVFDELDAILLLHAHKMCLILDSLV